MTSAKREPRWKPCPACRSTDALFIESTVQTYWSERGVRKQHTAEQRIACANCELQAQPATSLSHAVGNWNWWRRDSERIA